MRKNGCVDQNHRALFLITDSQEKLKILDVQRRLWYQNKSFPLKKTFLSRKAHLHKSEQILFLSGFWLRLFEVQTCSEGGGQ